ncbi:hypothetical protein PORY_000298 [Pneumocystis oryctolagi]|uniref:Uncharacterized protein n=1 Tax=Pneumocystis oryctolagi TaxID=42067 RepID=A0ACB7CGK2_9ASCO|nr:hypothetical protein PORY_000298 [Pneumocystis oryctolagi]
MSGLERVTPRFTCERSKEWEEAERRIQAAKNPVENKPPVDHRSLYEKLQANRIMKEEEYQESWKLSNLIRTLDDEEIDFLDKLRKEKIRVEEETKKSVREGLEVFRKAREQFDQSIQQTIHLSRDLPLISKPSESTERPLKKKRESILKGVILKKNKDNYSKRAIPKAENQHLNENADNKQTNVSEEQMLVQKQDSDALKTPMSTTPSTTLSKSPVSSDQKLIVYASDSDEKVG